MGRMAVLAFSAVIEKSPRDGEAYFRSAPKANFEQGQYQAAFEDGMSAVHFSPDDSESFLSSATPAALQVRLDSTWPSPTSRITSK